MKLHCNHADTCLSDFWSGHRLAHICVPVDSSTTITALRHALHSELSQGAVMGNEPLVRDDSGPEGDAWYKAAHAAINRDVRLSRRKGAGALRPFHDIEPATDDCNESVYAYFVFTSAEE